MQAYLPVLTQLELDASAHCLIPTTPLHSARYTRPSRARPTHKLIPAGLYSFTRESEPNYLPPNWTSHIQPEGQLYFYNSESRIVTEANINHLETLTRLTRWAQIVENLVRFRGITLPERRELFLELLDDDCDKCNYYFIDHDTRADFWLTEVETDQLGIPETTSLGQLRWALEEHYWSHVEYFPSHLTSIPVGLAHDLTSILSHGQTDHLTSKVATFPFTASQCSKFMKVIRNELARSGNTPTLTDSYIICVVARIWSQVARHRLMNFYGEENARLSRDQRLLGTPERSQPFYAKAINTVLFGEPEGYIVEFDSIWVDAVVYAEPWVNFMKRRQEEWKEVIPLTLGLLIAHVMFLSSGLGSKDIGLASMTVCVTGLLAAIALAISHRRAEDLDTSAAAEYLHRADLPSSGFRFIATLYSIPRALLFWATALFLVQVAVATLSATECAIARTFFCLLVFGGVCGMLFVLRRSIVERDASLRVPTSDADFEESTRWWHKLMSRDGRTDIQDDVEKLSLP